MAQDYSNTRRSNASRNRNQPRAPAWVWLFTGAVLGAFIMFLMHLSDMQTEPAGTREATAKRDAAGDDSKGPRFDFYELLKETKVKVPDSQASEQGAAPDSGSAGQDSYILQVASLRSADDAEQLRAELILLNLDAHTEQVKIRNGEIWYRVLVGPFGSHSKMAKARSILLSNQHEALVLKRKLATVGTAP